MIEIQTNGIILVVAVCAAALVQFKKRRPDFILTLCLLFYILIPSVFQIELIGISPYTVSDAYSISTAFTLGFLTIQIIPCSTKKFCFLEWDLKRKKVSVISLSVLYGILIYISCVVVASGFVRDVASEYLSNKIQIGLLFGLAFSLYTTNKKKHTRLIYTPFILASSLIFLAGGRIYLIPSFIFILIFNLKVSYRLGFVAMISFAALCVLLSIALLRNFDGEIFSDRSFITVFGEFYYTYLSFLVAIDNNIALNLNLFDAVSATLFPSFYEIYAVNSDYIINQIVRLDFGLGSNILNDLVLLQFRSGMVFFLTGSLLAIIYRLAANGFSNVCELIGWIFISFTPIAFRSGALYLVALAKTMVIYTFVIIAIFIFFDCFKCKVTIPKQTC